MNIHFNQYLKLARPRQWAKQLLVLMPLISEGHNLSVIHVVKAFIASVIFTFTAVAVYYYNDFRDFEEDQIDLVKKNRPIATEVIPRTHGLYGAFLFTIIALTSSIILIGKVASLVLAAYLIINLIYSSLQLKSKGNIGAFVVASGFALRWTYGTFAISIKFSWWAVVLIMQLALFMLSGKRFQKNKRISDSQQLNDDHDYWLLSLVIYASLFLSTYASFIAQRAIQVYWSQQALLVSTLPIALGLARYIEIVTHPSKYKTEDATETMLRDKVLIILGVLYITVLIMGKFSQN